MPYSFHIPVLAKEVLDYIVSDKSGIYVDCTLGGGGHSKIILEQLSKNAKLVGIDQDQDSINEAKKTLRAYDNVQFFNDSFNNLSHILMILDIKQVDGILLDLGVSSFQINNVSRGFTYSKESALDMRMNVKQGITAAQILNEYGAKDLANIFFNYGEERRSRSIADLIVKSRKIEPLISSNQLTKIIDKVVNPKFKIKSYARIFQALRIEVNQELESLNTVLSDSLKLLKKNGRLLVISYHSLEDRIVKRFLKYWADPCDCPKEIPECVCGKIPEIKIISKKAITASESEIKNNVRSRSALLRVGEKI